MYLPPYSQKQMGYKLVTEEESWEGVRVLVRTDFNVPINPDGSIGDTFRIQKALPTIKHLLAAGARVVLVSHIGRDPSDTLQPVYEYLKENIPVSFSDQVTREEVDAMDGGTAILLENVRRDSREVSNDDGFARELAALADCYVNEAFPVCHREHASIVGVPKYLKTYAGIQLDQEVRTLRGIAENPDHPFVFILGGAKFETKLPLIEKFLDIADTVFVAGALMNEFFESAGYGVGKSVTTNITYDLSSVSKHPNIIIPDSVLVEQADGTAVAKKPSDILPSEMIVDVGQLALTELREKISAAKTVLWNGPTGFYEHGYTTATKEILSMLKETDAKTVVGGGDTVALISQEQAESDLSFVSTGGGAMLKFLTDGTLPGIDALVR